MFLDKNRRDIGESQSTRPTSITATPRCLALTICAEGCSPRETTSATEFEAQIPVQGSWPLTSSTSTCARRPR
jgi:hypothetical protein